MPSTRPLKILYVVHGYKPAFRIGGPITSVAAVAEGLVQRGHEVTVCTTNSDLDQLLDVPTDRRIDVEGVGVYYFTFTEILKKYLPFVDYVSRAHNYLYSPMMKQFMQAHTGDFDLVHTHLPFIYPTWLAGRQAARANKPLFYHQRGVLDPERLKFRSAKKQLYLRYVEGQVLRGATTLFALTEAEVTSYRLLGFSAPSVVVPNGIDASAFGAPSDTTKMAAIGIRPEDLVLLFMARIHPTKGPDRILQAFAEIADRFPDAKLVLAGPDEFFLASELQAFARSKGLEGRLLMPGMIVGDLKADLLSRADLFCLASDAEGFSIAVLEALASRTPVLISNGCHFAEVESADAGKVVEPTAAAFAAGLLELLADRDRLRTMGQNGRRLVEEHYSWPTAISRTEAAYREGIERHRSRQ